MSDSLSKDFFDTRFDELTHRVTPKRLGHVLGVVNMSEKLAKAYGVDVKKARLAALLHDWDKGYDDAGIQARARELGLEEEIGVEVINGMPRTIHGFTAAAALSKEFPDIPTDVIRAVKYHTTACTDMTDLDMVIYIADALEENRVFDDVDDMRASIGKVSLEDLFFRVQAYWIIRIIMRGHALHPSTIDTWNYYALTRMKNKDKHE